MEAPNHWRGRVRAGYAALALAIAITPSVVRAETVAVLGLRAPDGDDVFAANYTSAVRAAANAVPEWDQPSGDPSLDQMLLAHGCPVATEACLHEIANSLGADQLIFGTVWHRASLEHARFEVEVALYDARRRRTLQRVRDTIPQYQFTESDLRQPTRRVAGQLSGRNPVGAIRVISNIGSASVFLDGEHVGSITEGHSEVEVNAPPGPHYLEVRAHGYDPYRRRIGVRMESTVFLETRLRRGDHRDVGTGDPGEVFPEIGDHGIPNWLPWSLLGFAVATGVLQVVAWREAERAGDTLIPLEDDAIVLDYRRRNPTLGIHPCDAIDQGIGPNDPEVRSQCASSRAWAIVTYVALPLFLVSAVAGTVLLIIDMEDDSLPPRPRRAWNLRIAPWLSQNELGVGASLDF